MCLPRWTVRTVKGSVQVLRVYLQLSNLDFWVRLQKTEKITTCGWQTNEIRYLPTIWSKLHSDFDVSLFQLVCWQERVFVVWFLFFQLTRWVHNAKYSAHPVFYLNGESGFLSHMSVSSQAFSSSVCGNMKYLEWNWFLNLYKAQFEFKGDSQLLILQFLLRLWMGNVHAVSELDKA